MSGTTLRIPLPGPVDVPASVEFLRRNGDDLMDRWDGDRLIRVLIVCGRRVPVAMRPVGDPHEPALLVTVPDVGTGAGIGRDELSAAVAGQFAVAGSAWPLLLKEDRPLADLVSRSPQITLRTPGGKNSAAISASTRVETGVVSDGFSTTVLPAARAGANFQTAIIIG